MSSNSVFVMCSVTLSQSEHQSNIVPLSLDTVGCVSGRNERPAETRIMLFKQFAEGVSVSDDVKSKEPANRQHNEIKTNMINNLINIRDSICRCWTAQKMWVAYQHNEYMLADGLVSYSNEM